LPHGSWKDHARAFLASIEWPNVQLKPRRVRLGQCSIRLVPHVGEFDFFALVDPRLNYEDEVFAYLDDHLDGVEVVVEIGANVGAFTCYFSQRLRNSDTRIYAFEPSPEAFRRLTENLAFSPDPRVHAFQAAVSATAGIATFYEPSGHLTNGSMIENFARVFSSNIRSRPVLTVDLPILRQIVGRSRRTLLKIDVEGYEAPLLASLRPWLEGPDRPELMIEVLEGGDAPLNELDFVLRSYQLLHLRPRQPVVRSTFVGDNVHRDYYLIPRASN